MGGGDSALDEGHYLSGIVNSVTFIHRRDELRGTKVLQERAFKNEKVNFLWSHVVEEFRGDEALDRALVKNLKTDELYEFPMAAAFIYVGFHPNTDYVKGLLELDAGGHIFTDINMRTAIPAGAPQGVRWTIFVQASYPASYPSSYPQYPKPGY